MNDLNMVLITGRLTKDAELKRTKAGDPVAGFSLAVNHSRKDSNGQWVDEPDYIDCKMWGKQAETLSKYLVKGKKILVNGEFRQEKWTDQHGAQRSRLIMNVTMMQFLGASGQGKFNDEGIPF